MADVITRVAHLQIENSFASTKAEDLALEGLRVTLDGAAATIYCDHPTNKGVIHTVLVRKALLVIATASNAAAYAETAAMPGPVISSSTELDNDIITLNGVTAGVYDVLIIGYPNRRS